jgi:hypothetical protein
MARGPFGVTEGERITMQIFPALSQRVGKLKGLKSGGTHPRNYLSKILSNSIGKDDTWSK